MKTLIVDTDDVLALFGASDRDIYAKGTIEDAIYDGTLKPAEIERKTGYWIYDDNDWSSVRGKCSVCGWKAHVYEDDVVGMDYCPNCGSRLLIEKEGEG